MIKDCDFYEKLGLNNTPLWNNVANIPSFVPRAAYIPHGSKNRPASVSAGSAFPAGSRNIPASVSAGRPFSAGWRNYAAIPMTDQKAIIFNILVGLAHITKWTCMGEDGELLLSPQQVVLGKINRPYMQWGSKNNGGSHQSTWFNS